MGRLYLDCTQGARKDTLAGALFNMLGDDARDSFLRDFTQIGLRDVALRPEGQALVVEIGGMTEGDAARAHGGGAAHHHEHHSVDEVKALINSLAVPESVRWDALSIYDILAAAEAKAHGVAIDEVHFHEVGNVYAVASIVAVCMLIDNLGCDEIVASPIATGYGFVDCAHGRLPIPAPATANVLEGLPSMKGDVEGELCTPTGAAIVRHFAQSFELPSQQELPMA